MVMHVIVPLAGPDFVRPDGSVKALIPLQGKPLLQHVLQSRPWSSEIVRYTFIFHDNEVTRTFVREHLMRWYPNAEVVFLSRFSRGAACSTLAGVSVREEFQRPLIVDLADILYSSVLSVEARIHASSQCGGIALTFPSENVQYSYLRCDNSGRVVEAAEKKVISNHASAGTYIFRDCSVFLKAVAYALENEPTQVCKGLFYVCPLFNGVLAQGMEVELEPVHDIVDIKVDAFPDA